MRCCCLLTSFQEGLEGGIVLMSFQEDPHQKLFFQGSKFCKMANCIIKRVSGMSRASEAFSLVMKTNKCLRLRVLARNACLHLAYVSTTGICILNWHTFPHLVNMSSLRIDVDVFQRATPPPRSWVCVQKIMRLPSRVQLH